MGPEGPNSVSMVDQIWTGFLRPSIYCITGSGKCSRPLFNERLLKLEHCPFFVAGGGVDILLDHTERGMAKDRGDGRDIALP
jgi:hypothetical protein